jgi:hypothetical protein
MKVYFIHKFTNTHTHTHYSLSSMPYTRMYIYTCTYIYTHAHANTHTHTHTQMPISAPWVSEKLLGWRSCFWASWEHELALMQNWK